MRAAFLALALTACGTAPAPRPTAAPTTPPTAPPTTPPAPTTPTTTPTTTPPERDEDRAFVTPSGNVACEMTVEHVECSVREHTWQPPGGPCRDEPARVEIWDGAVRADCGETGAEASSYLLTYGDEITVGRFRCESARSGVTCRHRRSGLGFTVSRARYRTYP